MARVRRKGMGRGSRPSGQKEGEEGFSFLFRIFLQNKFQNATSTQFKIRLQTKQFKIVCSGMYAHSWLILYLTFSFIKNDYFF